MNSLFVLFLLITLWVVFSALLIALIVFFGEKNE